MTNREMAIAIRESNIKIEYNDWLNMMLAKYGVTEYMILEALKLEQYS